MDKIINNNNTSDVENKEIDFIEFDPEIRKNIYENTIMTE